MNYLYLFISALFYVAAFSPFDLKILIFLSLIFFLMIIENLVTRKKILFAFLYFVFIHIIGISWINISLISYGSMNMFSSLIVTIVFIIVISAPYAVIGLFHKSIQDNGFYNLNIIALIFLLAEYIKSIILGGFPWLLIGHSQNSSIFNYIYPIFGSYFVTYLCVLISAFFYKTIINPDNKYIYLSSIIFIVIIE